MIAVMPGRCAAPPAPAMMSLKACRLGTLGKKHNSRSGGAMRGKRLCFSLGYTERGSGFSAAWRMVSPRSDWLSQ